MKEIDLNGIFPPIPTLFIDGKVSYEKLALNIEKWGKTGIKGFVVLGSNGEYVSLSEEEKREVVKTAVESSPSGMPVIVGSGCESTEETLRLTREVASFGTRAALVITPFYYGGMIHSQALIKHYTTVADQSPIPILLYNVPKFTHINLTPQVVTELSKHPNIIGIKDSTGNVSLLGEYLNGVDNDFNVMVGTAGPLFGALTLGCVGGILALANVAPEQCVNIYNLVKEGRFEEAKNLQLRMIPVNQAVTATYGVAGLKTALDLLGYFGGEPRLPLLPTTDRDRNQIEEILMKADLIK